jgi:hypothetical protein
MIVFFEYSSFTTNIIDSHCRPGLGHQGARGAQQKFHLADLYKKCKFDMIIHAWFADNYPFLCDVIVGHFIHT